MMPQNEETEGPHIVVGIDAGDVETAFVVYRTDTKTPVDKGKLHNPRLQRLLCEGNWPLPPCSSASLEDLRFSRLPKRCVIEFAVEMVENYGKTVGRSIFETCVWIGRFIETLRGVGWPEGDIHLITRRQIKLNMTGLATANDRQIRQAICDRYGGDPRRAKGTKKAPGPLFGFADDMWSALAVAITATEARVFHRLLSEEYADSGEPL